MMKRKHSGYEDLLKVYFKFYRDSSFSSSFRCFFIFYLNTNKNAFWLCASNFVVVFCRKYVVNR